MIYHILFDWVICQRVGKPESDSQIVYIIFCNKYTTGHNCVITTAMVNQAIVSLTIETSIHTKLYNIYDLMMARTRIYCTAIVY